MAFMLITLFLTVMNIFYIHGKHFLVNVKDGPDSAEEMQRLGSVSDSRAGDYSSDYYFRHSRMPRKQCVWVKKVKRKICYRYQKKRANNVNLLRGFSYD